MSFIDSTHSKAMKVSHLKNNYYFIW